MERTVRAYAPGRTELAGNHTDHQGGRVIAAALDCGVEVELQPNESRIARLASEGFAPVELDIGQRQPRAEERGTTAALVRGVVSELAARGVESKGFDACVKSTVPAGSGLSSSAAFELALASAIIESCAGKGDAQRPCGFGAVALARVGQAAERDYFGKPCGLMDQLAVALGGISAIDFAGAEPDIERLEFDFAKHGHALCIIDTHCDHSAYTEEYAQVALDMFAVAELFGRQRLADVEEHDLLDGLGEVRKGLGDLPALRAMHYYNENRLVDTRARAMREGDMKTFLEATRRSAASSAAYLQNVSTADRGKQPAMIALALADALLQGEGASRIHGGGFGGTIQAFVPRGRVDEFARQIDAHLGEGSCRTYGIDGKGAHAQCL